MAPIPSTLIRTEALLLAAIILIPLGCDSPAPPCTARVETEKPVQTAPAPVESPLIFSAEELAKVYVEVSIERQKMGGTLAYLVHNGSRRNLASIGIEITVKNKDDSIALTQRYVLDADADSSFLPPFTASPPYCTGLGLTFKEDQTWTWRLVGAMAFPEGASYSIRRNLRPYPADRMQ